MQNQQSVQATVYLRTGANFKLAIEHSEVLESVLGQPLVRVVQGVPLNAELDFADAIYTHPQDKNIVVLINY